MVDAKRLLDDLKKLRKKLESDLRTYHAASAARAELETEWRNARETKRTADTFETFFSAALDQAAVHWILAIVFLRFLEDNGLLDRPLIAGRGERLELAQLRQRDWFRNRPQDSDAEYLLAMFTEVARLPGLPGLFDPAHNPLFRLPISGDGAIALFAFFRGRSAETGELVHDFTDPDWNTRFLGDLYQDLSEDARKRYALLQTPEFIEEWILSRTLDPAIREFGYEQVRMIDPACGSGHFLLGGFARLLEEWRRHAPEMPPAAQAQRALDSVVGVDLNPFAVEISRFRLLVAALNASGGTRLVAAPDFRIQLATGDSLLHGQHFARHELGGTEDGFRRVLRHHYIAEDTAALDSILGRQYHAVVGNPPYITPKDAAMREAYREIYESAHGKYGLGAPFIERFFDLAIPGAQRSAAGFVGLIVANSFMKREFGKKLIESVLPRFDLEYLVDASSAYVPGHTTPTIIMMGRSRDPISRTVRTVRVISGAPNIPEDPAKGEVWLEIVNSIDRASFVGDFISTEDTPRDTLAKHPWNLGGGGAVDAQAAIEGECPVLASVAESIGIVSFTLEDDLYLLDRRTAARLGIELECLRPSLGGDDVRDWGASTDTVAVFPYQTSYEPLATLPRNAERHMWAGRSSISNSKMFGGKTKVDVGLRWFEFGRLTTGKLASPFSVTFGEITTHNHFVLDRGGKIFDRTAPVIKLPIDASESAHLGLVGILNSSVGAFWLKQVCANKGGGGIGGGLKSEYWDRIFVFNATKLENFPIASECPIELASAIDAAAQHLALQSPNSLCARIVPSGDALDVARTEAEATRARMIALQEELDWQCYRLYGLIETAPEHRAPPPLRLGERAFEIVMARRIAAGELETAWFERHRATPITELPTDWPADYRAIVERRIALIGSDPNIGLIERPEYKRRWSMPSWDEREGDALRVWLLDRLEHTHFWPTSEPHILSARALADAARSDSDFLSVAELYVGRSGFDVEALVAELVADDSVPFLAVLRYTESGLRKRADWEATWERQRLEDAIEADVAARRGEFARIAWERMNPRDEAETAEAYAARMAAGLDSEDIQKAADSLIAVEAKKRKQDEVGDIAVPPKYKTADFKSQDYWRLRGGLDVQKERFISFPHCARDADPSLPVLWAGHDHLARARAIAAWYVERRETDGWLPERLKPLLAGLLELGPWLRQWHNNIDPQTGLRMGDFFVGYVEEQARELGLTLEHLRGWTPPASVRRVRRRRTAA